MPEYTYQHPKTKELISVIQTMKEKHVYIDDKGVEWLRVFEIPNAKIDGMSNINPFSEREFMEKTNKKGGTLGDLWDLSAELSEKRTKITGKDPVKEKTVNKYKKKTGKPHPLAKNL